MPPLADQMDIAKMEAREDLFHQLLHFPEDILLEILSKLPAKSLFRFKCVSKKWLSLISDPPFFSFYVSRTNNSLPFAFIFQYNDNRPIHLFTSDAFKKIGFPLSSCQLSHVKVEATCNDLILHQTCSSESNYFIINPFTKNCAALPLHSTKRSSGPTGLISCVRNAATIYKVVRITEFDDENRSVGPSHTVNLEIFSSETGKWKSLDLKTCKLIEFDFDPRPCVALNGVLHWICNRFTTLLAYYPFGDQDKFRFISIPNDANYVNGINTILGVSQEKLCYFEMNGISIHACKFPKWKLWVLEDYENGEWSLHKEGKERNIDFWSSLVLAHSLLMPVAFHPWNKDIVFFLYEGYVLTFNVKKGWFEDEHFLLYSESLESTCTVFPLVVPFHPTEISAESKA